MSAHCGERPGNTWVPTIDGDGRVNVIKVSAESRTSAVAGAIAGVVRESKRAEVQAIGAGAVNQAVKAVAIARGYLHEDGLNIICLPEFTTVSIDGKERTAIRLVVEPR
jgi:stage V sporulation protein S